MNSYDAHKLSVLIYQGWYRTGLLTLDELRELEGLSARTARPPGTLYARPLTVAEMMA